MRIIVAGGSGYIGTALNRRLREAGHEIVQLVRRPAAGPGEVSWRPNETGLDPAVVDGADAAVNLAGVGVGDHRWTAEYKKLLRSSRINSTRALAQAIADAPNPPKVLLNASAVGFYGDRGDTELDESSAPGTGYFPELCQAWEAATEPAEPVGVRVLHLRTGLVLGPGGGLLGPMLPLFRLGLGFRMGNGRQWMSWISLADEVGAIEFLLTADQIAGPVNLTAPAPVRNADFAGTFGKVLHRPAVLPVPAVAMRLGLGEFGSESLASQRVLPAVLTGAGYSFQHPDPASALRWSTGKSA
jgi:uncharacterized protein (TIGR01777 family)